MPPKHRTPSPHRFVTGQRRGRSSQKGDASTPATVQRAVNPTIASQTPVRPQQQPTSSSRQFVDAPRFGVGKPKTTPTQRSPSPQKPLASALPTSRRPADDVEDAAEHDEGQGLYDDEKVHAVATTESDASDVMNNPDWARDLAFSPKRRRLDNRMDDFLTTKTDHRSLDPPNLANSIPRFSSLQPNLTGARAFDVETSYHRPVFLRPSAPPQEPSEPLPETFSPHKRGQKFVPGGMAATVQQWVIETGQAAVQSRRGRGYLGGEDYVARVNIDRSVGHGPFVVQGKDQDMRAVDLLLAGKVDVNAEAPEVDAGSAVGLRAPTWEVDLDGRCWTVAVDWRMIS